MFAGTLPCSQFSRKASWCSLFHYLEIAEHQYLDKNGVQVLELRKTKTRFHSPMVHNLVISQFVLRDIAVSSK